MFEIECFSRTKGWRRTGTVFRSRMAADKWLKDARHPEKWRVTEETRTRLGDKREIKPFGPFEDPKTCQHKWERHLWEPGLDHCPHCTATRPHVEGTP